MNQTGMTELEILLRKSAGIPTTTVEGISVPPDQNHYKGSVSTPGIPENQNRGKLGVKKSEVPDNQNPYKGTIESPGVPEGIQGKTSEIDTQRPEGETSESTIEVDRPEKEETTHKVSIKRGGELGKTSEIDTQRGGDLGQTSEVNIQRGGELGKTSDIETQRGGEEGKSSEVDNKRPTDNRRSSRVERPGVPKNQNKAKLLSTGFLVPEDQNTVELPDLEIKKPEGEDIELLNTPYKGHEHSFVGLETQKVAVPEDQNTFSLSEKNPNWEDVVSKVDSISKQIVGILGKAGIELTNFAQVNNLVKLATSQLPGNPGLEAIMGFNPNNTDIIAYYKRLSQGNNIWRLTADIAQRVLLYLRRVGGKWYNIDLDALLVKWLSKKQEEKVSRPDNDSSTNKESSSKLEVYSWDEEQGKFVWENKSTSDYLKTVTGEQNSNSDSSGSYTKLSTDITFTDRNKLLNFEMADNFYWGLTIEPYTSSDLKSELPSFPADFSNGWWPVLSCSFTKGSLKSKNFNFPFFTLEIPHSGERPSAFKMQVLDNATHDIRYWLESYIDKCFDIDNNVTLPYKKLLWDITVYRYDNTFTTFYKKRFLMVLASWNAIFEGASSHGEDDIDLDFEIVGEIPNDEFLVRFK